MKKLFLIIALLPLLIAAQTKTIIIPPSKDTVRITYTATTTVSHSIDYLPTGPGNKPPIASAGNDVSITLPTNTVTLSAGASSDADGTITNYSWSKVSGGTAILNQANTALNASGLVQGTYVFRVTVTDNGGLADIDDVNVVVLPAVSNPDPPTPAGYTLVFQRSLDALESGDNPSQVGQGSFVSFDGRKVFKSLVYGDSRSNVSSGYRSEIQYGSNATPSEGAVEYEAYYENWVSVSGGGSGVQWHPCQSGPSAFLLLGVSTGKFDMARSINGNNFYQSLTRAGTLMTIPKNQWVKHRVEYKFATSGGYARHYVNGTLVYSETNVQTTTTGCQYLKLGQNRWNVVSGQNTVIYFDQLRVYKKS